MFCWCCNEADMFRWISFVIFWKALWLNFCLDTEVEAFRRKQVFYQCFMLYYGGSHTVVTVVGFRLLNPEKNTKSNMVGG